LHAHGRRCEHSFLGGVGQLEHDRHPRRPRRFSPHGEPIEKTAAHLFTSTVKTFGYFIIEAGGDTDTIASIAGQIAGTWIGASQISREMIQQLPDTSDIERIADEFASAIETAA